MDINKLQELVNSGCFYDEIAKQLNCNITTVKRWTKRLHLLVKTRITRSKDLKVLDEIEIT